MNYFKHILFFLVVTTLTFSCKKEEDLYSIEINGTVMDGATLLPIANSYVKLHKDGSRVKETYSDVNGNYSFFIENSDGKNYDIEASKLGYIYSYRTENPVPPHTEKINNLNIKLYPAIYIDITVKMIDTTYTYMSAASLQGKMSYPHVFLQRPSDTIKHLILYKKGGINNTFNIEIEKSNSSLYPLVGSPAFSAHYSHTVYCSPSDTTYYTIQY